MKFEIGRLFFKNENMVLLSKYYPRILPVKERKIFMEFC